MKLWGHRLTELFLRVTREYQMIGRTDPWEIKFDWVHQKVTASSSLVTRVRFERSTHLHYCPYCHLGHTKIRTLRRRKVAYGGTWRYETKRKAAECIESIPGINQRCFRDRTHMCDAGIRFWRNVVVDYSPHWSLSNESATRVSIDQDPALIGEHEGGTRSFSSMNWFAKSSYRKKGRILGRFHRASQGAFFFKITFLESWGLWIIPYSIDFFSV